ncbi:MAG: pyruvate kinase [Bacillota bacterium]|nr:pyruvate kinase [Bacillota bacterium]
MKTKIVATIGPSSDNEAVLMEMMRAGLNVARLNFSHGSHAEHQERIRKIRAAAQVTVKNVAIMLDTKGPEIRVKEIPQPIEILVGGTYRFTASECEAVDVIPITYKNIARDVSVGSRILVDDGNLSFMVISLEGDDVFCRAENSGIVKSRKGINIPEQEVGLPAITEKDKEDIIFGIQQRVDFIAASFVRNADHVREIKAFLQERQTDIPVIAKIESRSGIDHLEEILQVADGIMVARGDLGVEIPLAEVPLMQKKMIRLCNYYGKPVITATQMLESMTQNPRPTRAEVNDVANAIWDGTDAVMLSGESAAGKFPIAAVRTMAEIAAIVENTLDTKEFLRIDDVDDDVTEAIGRSAVQMASSLGAKAIVIPTNSGETARLVARFRPGVPMIATSPHQEICRRLALTWGIDCFYQPEAAGTDETVRGAMAIAKEKGYVQGGDLVMITAGSPLGYARSTNLLLAAAVEE